MNIACTACSARYGVADEKLIGKRVRITCKRCGTVLVVDGNSNPPTVTASTSIAPSPPASTRPAGESRASAPVAEPPFMVAFADGRQDQADIAQIVRFHRAGQLGTDSLVWREGMADWADPWDVAEIAAAFRRMGYSRPTPAPAPPPAATSLRDAADDEATQVVESSPHHQAPPLFDDNEPTNVIDSSPLAAPAPQRDPRVASRPVAEDDESPTHVGREPRAAAQGRAARGGQRVSSRPPREATGNEPQRASRQTEPQRARAGRSRSQRPQEAPPAEDLFARQRMAGSEEDQAQQDLAPGYELDIPKLTGARNESSVLFSLDSLLKQEQKSVRPARPPRRDESLLVDSGSSLPVGGGFAPALAAPDFTAPISAPPPQFAPARDGRDDDTTRSSRAWLYVLVLVAFGGAGALGWTTGVLRPLLVKAGALSPPPATASAAAAAPAPSETPAHERVAATNSAEPQASAAASSSAAAASSGEAPPAASGAKPVAAAGATNAPRPPATGTAAATPKPPAAATTTATHEAQASKDKDKDKEAAKEATPAAAAGGAPFDTASAKEALTAAAGNVASCKEMGGPVGSGKVSITFAPSGRPTSVAVTGALVGTTVGSCVARLFRTVKVPPFAGDAVTVSKGFSLE